MFKFFNKNPSQARENTEKAFERMKKINNALEAATSGLKNMGAGMVAVTGIIGFGFLGLHGAGMGFLAGAVSAVPVVTAAMILPVVAQNVVQLRMDALGKKLANPIPGILDFQKQKTKNVAREYKRISGYNNISEDTLRSAKEDVEKQEWQESVLIKAAERAKQEGKEKTIGRLMNVVQRAEAGSSGTSAKQMFLQSAFFLASLPLARHAYKQLDAYYERLAHCQTGPEYSALWYDAQQMLRNPPTASKNIFIAATAVAVISAAAAAYCTYKLVQNHDRELAADRALGILDRYANGR